MTTIRSFTGDWAFLSNFHNWGSTYDGLYYPTAEHAFQAAKSLDPVTRVWVRDAESPKAAKRRGRHLSLRHDWEKIKYSVMLEVLTSKFSGVERQEKLLETQDWNLVEGNTWHDQIWGDCYCGIKPLCAYEGLNMLGKLLEFVRADIQWKRNHS